jgi:transcriptional regulator with XRE-family HTH domain
MFSENLRRLRELNKLDKKERANILGISAQAVGQFENNKRDPSLDTLIKISKHFGVTLDFLLSDNENVNIVKIKNLIKKLNYNFKEFANDIGESVFEIERIVLNNIEPSESIINSICEKYGIPHSEFKACNDSDYLKSFCNANENRDYIDLAVYIKNSNIEPDFIKNIVKLVISRDQKR